MRPPFHLAFAVLDLDATRRFYVDVLGCSEGRSAERWVDFDFYGHQISAHLIDAAIENEPTNQVDGHAVPVRHFGAILTWADWETLADRLRRAGADFIIEPQVRFAGQPGEQATLFVRDPSGNALEFKAFKRESDVFAK